MRGASQLIFPEINTPHGFTSRLAMCLCLHHPVKFQLSLYTRARGLKRRYAYTIFSEFYTSDDRLVPACSCASIIQRALGPDTHTSRYYTYRRISSHVMKSSVNNPSLVLTSGWHRGVQTVSTREMPLAR